MKTLSTNEVAFEAAYSTRLPLVDDFGAFARELRQTGLVEVEVDGTASLLLVFKQSDDLRASVAAVLEKIAVNPKLYGSVKARVGDETIDY